MKPQWSHRIPLLALLAALNQRYPTLYETGADVATLELEVPNDGDSKPNWRLYRVNEPAPES